ncbi:yip1d-interacting factor 1 isoform X2 [Oratosquilla oratoria]|uniref:yip1d-interacting factor 1 isoform X2 n=1 Tax=Oratosquilla oratoria TaxID=337810 RepID=UPI003F7642D1
MDYPVAGPRQLEKRGQRKGKGSNMYDPYGTPQQPPPQLFEDTSSPGYQPQPQGNYDPRAYNQGYGVPNNAQGAYPGGGFPGTQFVQDPMMANMAMHYGQTLVGQGQRYMDEKLEKYVHVSKIKYYFAVDTAYVMKKLRLLFFPFTHTDWSVRYDQEEPVQPRYELNAPDLYIPVMAFITYVLVAGLCLGLQESCINCPVKYLRFSPDVLGIQASSAIVWLVLEIFLILATLYVMSIHSSMRTLDLVAFSSYKYVGMISALLSGLVLDSFGYYCVLLYCSLTIVVFMFRTLRFQFQGEREADSYSAGNKRRLYLLLFMSGLQPVMMWWLTYHLYSYKKNLMADIPNGPIKGAL